MNPFYSKLFRAADIQKGDILDVASDVLSIMLHFREQREKFDANQLLDALQEAVGEDGTVLIRTFNWDFCQGIPFHYKTTPSRVGSLGNIALKRSDFKRTKHALYSWCAWGREQEFLTEIDPTDAFGDDSVFAFLEEHNAYLLRVGNTNNPSLTSIHRCEQRANSPARFIKYFTGQYTGSDGVCREKAYSMFVRNLDYNFRIKDEFTDANLQIIGAIEQHQYQGVKIDKIDLKAAGDAIYQDFLAGRWENWVEFSKKLSPQDDSSPH